MRIFFILLLLVGLLHAKDSATLLKRGNAAYSAGKLDEAMKLYDEALVESPENPYLIFNRAVVLFKKGDFEKARDEFKSSIDKLPNLKRSDSNIECRALTAIGNCGFFMAKKYADLEVDNAIKLCLESIQAYENALRLNAKEKTANKNITASRMLLKKLLGIKYAQAQQQKQQEELGRKIKELAERQKNAADNTAKADKSSGTEELQNEQDKISSETEEIAKQLQPPQQPPQGQQQDDAQQENPLSQARQAQDAAMEKLKSNDLNEAEKQQRLAAEKLDEILKQNEQQQQQQQQKQQQQKGDENSEQKQDDSKQQDDSGDKKEKQEKQDNSDEQQQDADKEKQEAAAEESEKQDSESEQDAREIIDKERHDKREREKNRRGNYRAVPMDW